MAEKEGGGMREGRKVRFRAREERERGGRERREERRRLRREGEK